MAMLDPKLAILDETDSGLDIDALKIVAKGVNKLKSKDNATIIITHYQRLLNYIIPDYVHVLIDGKIVKSGNKNLAQELEKKGYVVCEVEDLNLFKKLTDSFIENINKFANPFRRPVAMTLFLFGTVLTMYLGIGACLPIDKSLTLGLF